MEKNTFASTFGKVAYYSSGTGKDIVFARLGARFSCFEKIATALAAEYRVLGIDLPGFGESEIPRKAMSVSDYAAAFKELLDELGITNPVIVAHSFGGRIALNYCAESGAEKLILVSSAGIRKRNFFCDCGYIVTKY